MIALTMASRNPAMTLMRPTRALPMAEKMRAKTDSNAIITSMKVVSYVIKSLLGQPSLRDCPESEEGSQLRTAPIVD